MLTHKQAALAKAVVDARLNGDAGTNAELVIKAGYDISETNSRQVAYRLINQESVQREIQRQLIEAGLDKKLQSKLSAILDLETDDAKTLPYQLDAIKELNKMLGTYAETKTSSKKVVLNVPGV